MTSLYGNNEPGGKLYIEAPLSWNNVVCIIEKNVFLLPFNQEVMVAAACLWHMLSSKLALELIVDLSFLTFLPVTISSR